MLFQVVIENGQKKIQPLTADTGAGNPVGTIIVVCSNQIPSNYLPLGTQYNTTLYPILYALLGTDTTPTASALGLPTLTSGQYAIKATSGLSENAQDNVINIMKEYIRNQNVLSAVENISLSTTSTSPTTMDYDGLLVMSVSGGPRTIYVNGAGYVLVGGVVSGATVLTSVTVPFSTTNSAVSKASLPAAFLVLISRASMVNVLS